MGNVSHKNKDKKAKRRITAGLRFRFAPPKLPSLVPCSDSFFYPQTLSAIFSSAS